MLRKLCQLGHTRSKYISARSLMNETEIWEGLNAFNMHEAGTITGCWTYVSQWMLNVPPNSGAGVNWGDWEVSTRINSFRNNDILRDLAGLWTPARGGLPRASPADARYRWIVFMHRHNFPERYLGLYAANIYSCTVWDRENETATWYDCWPIDHEQRSEDIRAYWENIPHGWPPYMDAALRNLTIQNISISNVDDIETHAHAHIAPAYSQFTMISIILWHIRNVTIATGSVAAPAPVYPTVEYGLTSGMTSTAIPRLIVTLLLMLRSNGAMLPYLNGNRYLENVREQFFIENRNMKVLVRRVLQQETLNTPDSILHYIIT